MVGILYNLLLIVTLPAAFLYFLWRIFVSRKSSESWRQNLGALPKFSDRPANKKLIWIHAVSVGELVASLPIQEELRRLMPDSTILVTTITQTGNAMARQKAKSADAIAYFPLDYPWLVNKALNRVRPDVMVLMETEFWPNFLAAANKRGIPIVLANGIISDRTMKKHRRWHWLVRWAVSSIDHCCMQNRESAERIIGLGAPQEKVRVLGSTKFDQESGRLSEEAIRALQAGLGLPDEAPVFVAGSTNPGEEEPILEAFGNLRAGMPDLRLIIASRRIERGDEIQAMVEAQGLTCARRSKKEPFTTDVLILDTFGELASIYAVGRIAFVGGTLIPKGGHSLIQPVLQGKPVLFGPHTFKTRDIAEMAIQAGVGFQVRDARELADCAKGLLSSEDRLASIDSACERLTSENVGASARCAELVVRLMGGRK
ncbi:MAG TPA: 3-deoxy-D-manno-octulosonic acid transferase [Armatimonadota bacterium]|nr:3-deoxy-D-manno-octulosonic acid transferase [Armatimonadota bacterium]